MVQGRSCRLEEVVVVYLWMFISCLESFGEVSDILDMVCTKGYLVGAFQRCGAFLANCFVIMYVSMGPSVVLVHSLQCIIMESEVDSLVVDGSFFSLPGGQCKAFDKSRFRLDGVFDDDGDGW